MKVATLTHDSWMDFYHDTKQFVGFAKLALEFNSKTRKDIEIRTVISALLLTEIRRSRSVSHLQNSKPSGHTYYCNEHSVSESKEMTKPFSLQQIITYAACSCFLWAWTIYTPNCCSQYCEIRTNNNHLSPTLIETKKLTIFSEFKPLLIACILTSFPHR